MTSRDLDPAVPRDDCQAEPNPRPSIASVSALTREVSELERYVCGPSQTRLGYDRAKARHHDPEAQADLGYGASHCLLEMDPHPNSPYIRPVPRSLLERAKALVGGVTVDLNAPLDPADD